MKRILVTGAGGSPAVNFVRSLKEAPEPVHLVGTDADRFYLLRAETDRRYLVPLARDAAYLDIINDVIDREEIEFVHAQNDVELRWLSEHRDRLRARVMLPAHPTVAVCQDKFLSYEKWRTAGVRVPETILLTQPADLRLAMERFGNRVWLRATTGAGGRGALPVYDYGTAEEWIAQHNGWGTFTAAELLEQTSTTWMSLWRDGRLLAAQGRKRLYWELSKVSPSGVSGATGAGMTVSDPVLDEVSRRAILAIDPHPHGLFGVDLTYDSSGVPNPTEINIGRFFTTHHFFTQAGFNMPHLYVRAAYGELPDDFTPVLNPLPEGLLWIRGLDFLPVLTSMDEVERQEAQLRERRRALGH